jgi:hypothetical protein
VSATYWQGKDSEGGKSRPALGRRIASRCRRIS